MSESWRFFFKSLTDDGVGADDAACELVPEVGVGWLGATRRWVGMRFADSFTLALKLLSWFWRYDMVATDVTGRWEVTEELDLKLDVIEDVGRTT